MLPSSLFFRKNTIVIFHTHKNKKKCIQMKPELVVFLLHKVDKVILLGDLPLTFAYI